MKDENFKFELIFDTEKDGFTAQKFHEKCDLKNNLLIVIESQEGQRFGGFTSLCFDTKNKNGQWIPNGFNFLFNLNNRKIYSQNDNNYSLYQHSSYGPIFGTGHDLLIYEICNQNQDSYSTFPITYGKNENAQQYELTKSKKFVVKRYQTFRFETKIQY